MSHNLLAVCASTGWTRANAKVAAIVKCISKIETERMRVRNERMQSRLSLLSSEGN